MKKTKPAEGKRLPLGNALLNGGLLLAALALGMISYFAALELVLTLGAPLIAGMIDDSAVRARYAFATLRNIWLLVGGVIWLAVLIVCVDQFFKHWRTRRALRLYGIVLAIEIAILIVESAL